MTATEVVADLLSAIKYKQITKYWTEPQYSNNGMSGKKNQILYHQPMENVSNQCRQNGPPLSSV